MADAIGATMRRKLSRAHIDALIDARNFDIETKIMPDWASLEAYLAATAGGLFASGAECSGRAVRSSKGRQVKPVSLMGLPG